jgi:D-aspartate ligase
VDTVSRHRDVLTPRFLLTLAPHPVVERLMDKERFASYAATAGLPVPRTEVLRRREDVEAVAAEVTYPCVVKPSGKSVSWLAHTSAKGFTVHDATHLLSVYDTVVGWSEVILLQEWVAGPESGLLSCNGFFGPGGQPLVTFMARKIRQWPPEVGTSASGEECRDDEALETAVTLFRDAGFEGLAYLEMKRDVRTGRLMIIEPNVGRPTGRSAVAEAGGVELLHTAYCCAAGLPLPTRRQQRYGDAKWLDLRRDLQAVAVARRRSTLTLSDWRRWARGPKAHAIWSSRDPAPFCVDLVHATSTGVRRAFGSRGAPAPKAETGPHPASVPAPRADERTRL